MIRAERAASKLKTAGKTVSNTLLVDMCLKELPDSFRPFYTVVTQKDYMEFFTFKVSLRNYEEN